MAHPAQPEQLSPALFRPGRIDKKFAFGLASKEQISLLFSQFFPDSTKGNQEFVAAINGDFFSVAELQGLFVDMRDEADLLASLPHSLEDIIQQRLCQETIPTEGAGGETEKDDEEEEDNDLEENDKEGRRT